MAPTGHTCAHTEQPVQSDASMWDFVSPFSVFSSDSLMAGQLTFRQV